MRLGAGGVDWDSLQYGTAIEGGYYAGKIKVGVQTFALIVAPKETTGNALYKVSGNTADAGTNSLSDGLTNSNSINNADHPAAQYCRSLTTGGYSDWYLPSRDELEICYRNLKPTTDANNTSTSNNTSGNGFNSNSDPAGAAYTSGNPTRTTVAAFMSGGGQDFHTGVRFWASTQFATITDAAWTQTFDTGTQEPRNKQDPGFYVRAVRRIFVK